MVVQVCLGDLALGGNFVFCLIIVAIFIGLGRAYISWLGGREILKYQFGNCRKARLDEMVKNGVRKCLYFMQLFWNYIVLGENFIG